MKIVSYHSSDNCATALVVKEARLYMYIIQVEASGLRIRKIPKTEARYFSDLEYKGKPYPVKRAVRLYKQYGKTYGITKAARKALAV